MDRHYPKGHWKRLSRDKAGAVCPCGGLVAGHRPAERWYRQQNMHWKPNGGVARAGHHLDARRGAGRAVSWRFGGGERRSDGEYCGSCAVVFHPEWKRCQEPFSRMTHHHGDRAHFNQQGLMTAREDSFGNQTTFAYMIGWSRTTRSRPGS